MILSTCDVTMWCAHCTLLLDKFLLVTRCSPWDPIVLLFVLRRVAALQVSGANVTSRVLSALGLTHLHWDDLLVRAIVDHRQCCHDMSFQFVEKL